MQESYRWWVYMYMRKGAVCRKWENSIELVVAVYNRESLPYIRQEVISQTQLNFSFFLFFLSPPGTAFIINALVYDICAFCAVPNKKAIHLLIDSRKMEKFVCIYLLYLKWFACRGKIEIAFRWLNFHPATIENEINRREKEKWITGENAEGIEKYLKNFPSKIKIKNKNKRRRMFSLEGSVTPYLTFGRLVSMCVHIFYIFIFYFCWSRYIGARVCVYLLVISCSSRRFSPVSLSLSWKI